jgi:hypothetical protein|tara:strand:+ start:759 stop:992 length:234 start_codon:yes stop_codon:yes gene_type:complete
MKCKEDVISQQTPCTNTECRKWMNYDKDLNCCLVSVERHGNLTLVQVAERLGVSHVRIKQIQDKALERIRIRTKDPL